MPGPLAVGTVAGVLTVAMWDLGAGPRPLSLQVPRLLRRVGADVVVVLRLSGPSPATVARQSGYRHRAVLDLHEDVPVSVFSRFPVSDSHSLGQWPAAVSEVSVHAPAAVLPLAVADLSQAPPSEAAAALLARIPPPGSPWLVTGDLGHDLGNPFGSWLSVRRSAIDPVQASGGVPSRSRHHGFLSHALEPRGSGTLLGAGGGSTDLLWVRLEF